MNTIQGTLSKWDFYNGGWVGSYSADTAYAGWSSDGGYRVAVAKLTTPNIPDGNKIAKITVNLQASLSGKCYDVGLRWALCTSDANKNSYRNTHSAVEDSNIVIQDTVTLTDISVTAKTHSFAIEVDGLTAGQTYYLFLWSETNKNANLTMPKSSSSVEFEYAPYGLVHISNGNTMDAYIPYVSDGKKWVQCIPYVSNGTDFVQCN